MNAALGMQNPDRLRVSKAFEDLADVIYDYTATLPRDERFGLVFQMRRAGVSVGSNIFEGCGRQGPRALLPFLYQAHGSTGELLLQTRFCRRRRFGDGELSTLTLESLDSTRGMLAKLIQFHEGR
jgi:four helix bundle protein